MTDLTTVVAEVLSNRPGSSAREIAQVLHKSGFNGLRRKEVNSCLYKGVKRGYFHSRGDDPPRWFLKVSLPWIQENHQSTGDATKPAEGAKTERQWRIKET